MSSSMTHATEYVQAMTSLAQGLFFGVAGQFGQQWWEAFNGDVVDVGHGNVRDLGSQDVCNIIVEYGD